VRSVGRLLGNIWSNLAIVVSFWSFNPLEEADRDGRRVSQKRSSIELHSLCLSQNSKKTLQNPCLLKDKIPDKEAS
jgi:hypothetical protein